ncbi:redoxin domain-containing protein, partial [bacterium]|nr:redoxin domain-containing protein [bacterium]
MMRLRSMWRWSRTVLFATSVLLLVSACSQKTYDKAGYDKEMADVETLQEYIDLHRTYAKHVEDLNLQRIIQDNWEEMDEDGAREFYRKHYETHRDSPEAAYLYGRIVDDAGRAIELARETIRAKPEWEYGYRLLLGTYNQMFRHSRDLKPEEVLVTLPTMLKEDDAHFHYVLENTPAGGELLSTVFQYFLYTERSVLSVKALNKARDMGARWAQNDDRYGIIFAAQRQDDKLRTAVNQEADRAVEAGRVKPEERNDYYLQSLASYYADGFQYGQAIEILSQLVKQSSREEQAYLYYNLACFAARAGDADKAIRYLEKAANKGYTEADWARKDGDLYALHGSDQWEPTLELMAANAGNNMDAKKREALAEKIEKDAPGWTLMDASGNPVTLSDLQGSVVVLDFWATWCGPCRMAMPEINEFTREHGGDKVHVYSVNVWENAPGKARVFMEKHDYEMTLLFGSDDITKLYEVTGIPTLVVIGPDG